MPFKKNFFLAVIPTILMTTLQQYQTSSFIELRLTTEIKSSFICPLERIELIFEIEGFPNPDRNKKTLKEEVKKIFRARLAKLELDKTAVVSLEENKILVQLERVKDVDRIKNVLEKIGQLEFKEQIPGTERELLNQQRIVREKQNLLSNPENTSAEITKLKEEIKQSQQAIYQLFKDSDLNSKNLIGSKAQLTQYDAWEISIKFDSEGSRKFTELTKNLAGTGRRLGIFVDGIIVSSPTAGPQYATEGITGGEAVITGSFSAETARELAIQISSGALPRSVNLLSEKKVNNERCQ